MKVFIVFSAVVAMTLAFPLSLEEQQQWENFKLSYGKTYASRGEEEKRMEIFAQNLREYAQHNQKYNAGLVLFKKGVNQFADLTLEEFINTLTPMNLDDAPQGLPFVPPSDAQAPDSIDWREKGAVTNVKDQGYPCGSCYTFSVTGALEGQLFLKTGNLVSLSEQNIIDCARSYYPPSNGGCHGGDPHATYKYIQQNGGIDTEDSYPYKGVEGPCRYNPQNSGGTNTGFVSISRADEDALQAAVASMGPMSIVVDGAMFDGYDGGIIHDVPCNPNNMSHAVLAVGYGSEGGQDYWIIKNSWGEAWGENGYARVARHVNQCGIANYGSCPTV